MATGKADLRKEFRDAGFEVVETSGAPDSFDVKKGACQISLARQASGAWQAAGPPTLKVRGLDCRLEDQGFQKFWLHGEQRFPIRVAELRTLHRFDEELRQLLGIASLYHESLGTRSARSAYDRLTGRPDQ